jgi:hypothetical protein
MIIGWFSSLEVHYHAPLTRAASGGIFFTFGIFQRHHTGAYGRECANYLLEHAPRVDLFAHVC